MIDPRGSQSLTPWAWERNMSVRDFTLAAPALRTDMRIVGLSTDTKPTVDEDGSVLQAGTEFISDDTGQSWYWTGSEWKPTTFPQKIEQLIQLQWESRDLLARLANEDEEEED